jgi:hypothetical protein
MVGIAMTLFTAACNADTGKYFVGATSARPAENWTGAFLSGNGRMGVMMFGQPASETVVLNHCQLYLPRGSREIVQDLAKSMPEIKAAGLKAGANGPAVVHKMMREKTGQKIIHTDPFHPACLLKLEMARQAKERTNYKMTEDFETGQLTVGWSDASGRWERKMFVSRADNVAVMSIDGPKGKVGCTLSMDINHTLVKPEITASGQWLSAHVVYVKGRGGYDCLIRVIADGGKVEGADGRTTVSGADGILLIMQVRPWKTPLPPEQSEAWAYSPKHPDFGPGHKTNLQADMKKHLSGLKVDYDSLFKPHVKLHGELFSRVKLDLRGGKDRLTPSDELLKRAADTDRMPLALTERMYDACRYLIICSSGLNPPNLQGIWTGTWRPAWSGDYTLDSNMQLEIQSMMSCNMPELMESYFSTVESWLPDCRLNAKKLYGCRGIVSNPRASNTCLLLHWGRWPGEQCIGCMGWMAHFFYDYYLFTGDKKHLAKRAIPLLKETALFYEDLLAGTEDAKGKYRFFLGYSPEHGMTANTTFDISVAKAVLTYLIEGCGQLGIEADNVKKWKTILAKMPPYLINEGGGLQEWSWPGAGEDYNQRHHSHFLPLYQFCEFDRDLTPKLWKASGIAFEGKVKGWLRRVKGSNSNHITHGMMNQGQCAARLGRSDVVGEVMARMATKKYIYPSFMISYWPNLRGFGFDPVGTIPDVVNNSLIFCWDGVLDILPALPAEWPKGSISGVLVRGQIRIDRLAWDRPGGKVDLVLTSGRKQDITLRLPVGVRMISAKITHGPARLTAVPEAPNKRKLTVPAGKAVGVELTISKQTPTDGDKS